MPVGRACCSESRWCWRWLGRLGWHRLSNLPLPLRLLPIGPARMRRCPRRWWALEQKMEELTVTSMRFSAETSFAVSRGSRKLRSS